MTVTASSIKPQDFITFIGYRGDRKLRRGTVDKVVGGVITMFCADRDRFRSYEIDKIEGDLENHGKQRQRD